MKQGKESVMHGLRESLIVAVAFHHERGEPTHRAFGLRYANFTEGLKKGLGAFSRQG